MTLDTIGQRIRRTRKKLNLTQKDLAKALREATHGSISQWESDITTPSAKNLYDLSIALECDFAWLLNGGKTSNVIPASLKLFKIPLITYSQVVLLNQSKDSNCLTNVEYITTSLKISKESFELASLNPDYKTINTSDKQIKIVGTMVEHRIFRRKR